MPRNQPSVKIALTHQQADVLNQIVNAYLDRSELKGARQVGRTLSLKIDHAIKAAPAE